MQISASMRSLLSQCLISASFFDLISAVTTLSRYFRVLQRRVGTYLL